MKYMIGLIVLVLMAAQALATEINVTCDGWWDGYACQPWELQDEVDEITGLIDDNADDIDDLQEDVQENADSIESNSEAIVDNAEDIDYLNEEINSHAEDIDQLQEDVEENSEDIDDLEEAVDENADDIEDNSDAIDKVSFMSKLGDNMLRQYSDWNDWILRRYSDMKNNELAAILKKYADENDGHGVSFRTVLNYLMTDYIDYLKDFFMTQKQADAHQEKLYELEARLNLCGCEGFTQEEYEQQYLALKAEHEGTKQCKGDICCYPDGLCLS